MGEFAVPFRGGKVSGACVVAYDISGTALISLCSGKSLLLPAEFIGNPVSVYFVE